MFVAYLQGLFVGNRIRPLAGIQIYDNYFVVFKDGAGGIEPSTFVHEFFHALGLRKESKEPRAHCPNRGCLMHPTLTEEYHYLCADCRKELKTLIDDLCRGKTKKLY